jgi:hypothetical protein
MATIVVQEHWNTTVMVIVSSKASTSDAMDCFFIFTTTPKNVSEHLSEPLSEPLENPL